MKPSRGTAMCLPFKSEDHYRKIVKTPAAFRVLLVTLFGLYPELFPIGFSDGFTFHDRRLSKKFGVEMRRIRIKATGATFLIRPSFLMPYCVAKTDVMEKALFLRRWGVPFDALAYVFGGDPKRYERALLALGRPSLVATTIKHADHLPKNLVADEKHTRLHGEKVYLTTTVARGCILGASVVETAGTDDLAKGYGDFAQEARQIDSNYAPESVSLDGWGATQNAWRKLFPTIIVVLCFLHSALKLAKLCPKKWGELRFQVMERIWNVYHAASKGSFAQRLRRFAEWAPRVLPRDWVGKRALERIAKIRAKSHQFTIAYDHPEAHRTSNMVDRLMSYQDRLLFAQRYFHGFVSTARLTVRAQALIWNFHLYSTRLRQDQPQRVSPFEDINGFSYHQNWLHNLLIAVRP